MRILRLVADGQYAVEFHPYVTVVTGLSDHQRSEVIQAFRDAVVGRPSALTGLMEVHEVVLDMDEASFTILDLERSSIDLLVDSGSLPATASTAMERQLAEAERRLADLEPSHQSLLAELRAAEAAADAARAEADQAGERLDAGRSGSEVPARDLDEMESELARVEADLDFLVRASSDAADSVEQSEHELAEVQRLLVDAAPSRADDDDRDSRRARLVADLDPDAAAALESALVALAAAEEDEDTGEGHEQAPDGGPVADRIDELEGVLEVLGSLDPGPVRAALDSTRLDPSAAGSVGHPEATDLADRLETMNRRVADLESRVEQAPTPADLEDATAQQEQIRDRRQDLERSVAVPDTVDADIAELERVHAELVDAREAVEGRFGKAKAQERLDAAQAAQEELLERLGLRSYTDLMAGGRAALLAAAEPDELRSLRAEEREAEWVLEQLQRQAGVAADLESLRADRGRLQDDARRLVGDDVSDDQLVSALRQIRVAATHPDPVSAVIEALEGVDLPVGGLDMSIDDLEAMAADWLEEHQRAERRRPEIEEELARLRGAGGNDPEPETATVDAARGAVTAAKDRVIAHERAVLALADLDEELGDLAAGRAGLDIAERRVQDAEAALDAARQDRSDIDGRRAVTEAEALQLRSEIDRHRRAATAETDEIEVAARRAEAACAGADERLRAARAAFDTARGDHDAAVEEVATLRHAGTDLRDEPVPVDETEWYLLARLAAQRQVSFAGSVPLVIDRALEAVEDEGLVHLLDRLERMAGAVQVVHLTDDERITAWAASVGEDRVAVVSPVVATQTAESGS